MNPSTKDLLDAIETVTSDRVVVLPNNKNVILAAEQASSLSSKSVAVIPTRSIPQGISALLALNHQADLEDNVGLMTAALDEVESGEITTATRSVTVNDVEVTAGQIIGLHDGELKVSGTTIEGVAQKLLKEMDPTDREIITLYYGDNVSGSDASTLADLLQQDWPDLEIEVINGGQSHYHYILSLE